MIARGDVKAASFVSLQADDEIMAARRGGVAIEKAFVVISFAVPVEVVQPGDLVAPEDEHLTVDDLDAQGLMQTGRIPPPDGPVTRQPLDQPDLSGHGGDRRGPIRQEINSADEE